MATSCKVANFLGINRFCSDQANKYWKDSGMYKAISVEEHCDKSSDGSTYTTDHSDESSEILTAPADLTHPSSTNKPTIKKSNSESIKSFFSRSKSKSQSKSNASNTLTSSTSSSGDVFTKVSNISFDEASEIIEPDENDDEMNQDINIDLTTMNVTPDPSNTTPLAPTQPSHPNPPMSPRTAFAAAYDASLLQSSTVDHFPEGYDPEMAAKLVMFSSASYCRIHECACISCGCVEQIGDGDFEQTRNVYNKEWDAKGFVGVSKMQKMIVAAFRGTVSLKNWLSNVDFRKAEVMSCPHMPKDVRLHAGFYKTYGSIREEMVDEVTRLVQLYPDFEIYVTGHSLGGALATLFTSHISMLLGVPVNGYTFGQPRVGNLDFRNHFNSVVKRPFFRIVNNFDPVVHVPLKSMGYLHVGEELWFTSNKTKVERKNSIRKNMRVALDMFQLPESGICVAEARIAHKLTVADHMVYYERMTGRKRLRGLKPPKKPLLDDGRLILVTDTVSLVMGKPEKTGLLFLYAPWCPFSKTSLPVIRKLALYFKKFEPNIIIAQMDAVGNDIPDEFPLQGYPTFYVVPKSNNKSPQDLKPILYSGPRTFKQMRDFILEAHKLHNA